MIPDAQPNTHLGTQNFTLEEVVYSYTPRQMGVSLVLLYRFAKTLPSQIIFNKTDTHKFNPYFWLVSSGKNDNLRFKTQIQTHKFIPNNQYEPLKLDQNLVYLIDFKAQNQPFWLSACRYNYSFEKIYDSQDVLFRLRFLPFVDKIYLCGSVCLEQSTKYSDLDLIVCTKPFFGLSTISISRFWIKAYLKIINRDVHPFITHYLWRFTNNLGLKKISSRLEKQYNNYKTDTRLRFDLGMVVDSRIDLDRYVKPDIDRLWFLARKRVLFEADIDYKNETTTNVWLNNFKYRVGFGQKFSQSILELFSMMLYPMFLAQYVWFWLFNRHDFNQFVSYKIWHSFTKVGFKKDRVVSTPNQKVYLMHTN